MIDGINQLPAQTYFYQTDMIVLELSTSKNWVSMWWFYALSSYEFHAPDQTSAWPFLGNPSNSISQVL